MAILMLQAQDKLNVQDPVCLYISECPVTWQDITIHQLLTHTSGIPNFIKFINYEATKATPSSPEQTIARFKDKPLDFPPGEQLSYSNSGYIVLGYIIEQVSGQSYEAFLQQNIFEPLHMKDTGYGRCLRVAIRDLYGIEHEPAVLTPPKRSLGDFAFPAAMSLARELKRNPREIGTEIRGVLEAVVLQEADPKPSLDELQPKVEEILQRTDGARW